MGRLEELDISIHPHGGKGGGVALRAWMSVLAPSVVELALWGKFEDYEGPDSMYTLGFMGDLSLGNGVAPSVQLAILGQTHMLFGFSTDGGDTVLKGMPDILKKQLHSLTLQDAQDGEEWTEPTALMDYQSLIELRVVTFIEPEFIERLPDTIEDLSFPITAPLFDLETFVADRGWCPRLKRLSVGTIWGDLSDASIVEMEELAVEGIRAECELRKIEFTHEDIRLVSLLPVRLTLAAERLRRSGLDGEIEPVMQQKAHSVERREVYSEFGLTRRG